MLSDHYWVKAVSWLTPQHQAILGKSNPAQTYVRMVWVLLGFLSTLRHRSIEDLACSEYISPSGSWLYWKLRSSGSTCCMDGIGATEKATWCAGAVFIGSISVGGMSGSAISIIRVSWMSTSTPRISILSTSDGYTPGISLWSMSDVSSPGISASPIGCLRLLIKTNCYGWLLPRALTWVITVSGIGITSQLLQTNFFPVLSAIFLKLPCRFPFGPSKIPPLFSVSEYCVEHLLCAPDSIVQCGDSSVSCSRVSHQTWWFLGSKCKKFRPLLVRHWAVSLSGTQCVLSIAWEFA